MPDTLNLDQANLTRQEAADRSALISTHDYDVHVDVSGAQDLDRVDYPTVTTLSFSCAAPGSSTFLDYLHHSVETVELNGVMLDVHQVVGAARILLPDLQAENTVTVVGTSLYSSSGEGMHRFQDPADGQVYLYTQYEPADARRVFPNFEQPDLKAQFTVHLTGPADWVLASNQPESGRRVVEQGEGPDGGSVTVDFSHTPALSTYITTLLAGPYHRVEDTWGGHPESGAPEVRLGLYCRQTMATALDSDTLFTVTKAGLDFFHELFGVPYLWGKYDQAFVPEYNLGAMENPGLVTFTEQYLFESQATQAQFEGRANTIMHEMAHMWFGDLVTMTWWDDLWLKESFADYMGTLAVAEATEHTGSWTTFASRRKAWAYVQDQYPTTHPIVADITDLEAARQNFDGITYAKGASVLKQLAAYVGRDAFISASREYFARHAWGNAELSDFLTVLGEVSGQDMQAWAEAWLQTSGVPELWLEAQGDTGDLVVRQEGFDPAAGRTVLRPHVLKVGRYEPDAQGVLARVSSAEVEVPGGSTGDRTVVENLPGGTNGGTRLLLVNDEDLTYAKIRLDEKSLRAVLEHPVQDSLARATVWAALWSMTRDGLMPARVFVDAVARLSASIPDVGVYSQVVEQAVTAVERFTPADEREQVRGVLAEALISALREIGPGSDRQRSALRAYARLARAAGEPTADQFMQVLEPLARRAQTGVPEGLSVDAEARWLALIALAALGRVDRSALDAARQDEVTARTSVWHGTAVAALPEPALRAGVWEAVMTGQADGEVLSNDQLTALADGFTASRPDLTAAFSDRFWPELEGIWSSRSNGLASRTIHGLFPATQDAVPGGPAAQESHPVVQSAQSWLDDHPAAPRALRRIIVEELDDLRRALRAQAS
ncbi:aminopeptidase N [Micrococcus terreus]|uniref:aminopeptidase N n=1 Tax=Micrococcus terreus TaxID=574650 RepID=UPI0025517DC3|nr:aminopeptidase N [Micrococcus terreus]MDK7699891.1 aminopeptidase N [Micrococcus terreus]WOO98281.1 aminopeptidase N [Micrococcus terreus]